MRYISSQQYREASAHTQKGYTLLFSILVASLVLAIGISILNINKKELLLTAGARDSAAAFYAADGGLECALYADNNDTFSTTDDHRDRFDTSCFISHGSIDKSGGGNIFTFHARFGDPGKSCAVVTVDKTPKINGDPQTVIDSRGYNTGWSGTLCDTPSPKRVERAIRYSY